MCVTKLLNSVAQHGTYCVSVGVYRSPAAVYVQVMPQLEKALTSDPKVRNYTQMLMYIQIGAAMTWLNFISYVMQFYVML